MIQSDLLPSPSLKYLSHNVKVKFLDNLTVTMTIVRNIIFS